MATPLVAALALIGLPANEVEDYGIDYETVPELDATFTPVTGARVVAIGVMRRWTIQKGSCFWDEDMGVNLHALVGADLTRLALEQWKVLLVQEATKVDGCLRCTVTFTQTEDALTIEGRVYASGGTFDLLVELDAAANILTRRIQEAA